MSLMVCMKHDMIWDSDTKDVCPRCENEPACETCGETTDDAGLCACERGKPAAKIRREV